MCYNENGTKSINLAVKRHASRFPDRFMFQLSDIEWNEESKDFLVTNCDQKIETRGGRYKNPRIFTEQGVYMLATILKSKAAVNTTIKIIETFVKMRHCITENKDYLPNKVLLLEEKVDNNTKKIDEIFDRFIIIDKKILYSCGSSFKDLGKKCFSINRFDDNEYLNKIIETIKI